MRLSGVLYDAGGPLASVQIKFEAAKTTLNGVIVSAERIFTTQQDGTYFIELEPGYYIVSWLERGRPVRLGTIVADTDSQMSLPEALEADYTPMQPSYIQGALDQMRADLEAAQTAASTAAADVSDMLTQAVAESADRAEQEANRAQAEADRANTYADNAGYVTRERLRKQATLDLDFALGDYALDDGEKLRTTNAGEVLTVERATPKWVFGPNGKLREVPPNTIARQWNPATGEPEGVLIEESRTNLLLWSEQPSMEFGPAGAGGAIFESTTETLAGIGCEELVEGSAGGTHMYRLSNSYDPGLFVFSFLAKRGSGERNLVVYSNTNGSYNDPGWVGGSHGVHFDLSIGEVKAVSTGQGWGGEVIDLGGGVFRCIVYPPEYTGGTVSLTFSLQRESSSETAFDSYQGDGISSVFIGGCQIEPGSTPSSYIPTEDAPVTRAADNVSRELGEEFNAREGAFVFDSAGFDSDGRVNFFRCGNESSTSFGLVKRYATHSYRVAFRDGTITLESPTIGLPQMPSGAKIGFSWSANEGVCRLSVDGVIKEVMDISPIDLSAYSGMEFSYHRMSTITGGTDYGHISKQRLVNYIPRALSESELIELTS